MVQIILNGEEVINALKSDLSPETREIIENKELIREGRWIYLKVTPKTGLSDIKDLILVRSHLKKIRKRE